MLSRLKLTLGQESIHQKWGERKKRRKKIPKCRNSNLTQCIFSQKTKITQVLEFYISCNRLFAKPPCKWVFFFFFFGSLASETISPKMKQIFSSQIYIYICKQKHNHINIGKKNPKINKALFI